VLLFPPLSLPGTHETGNGLKFDRTASCQPKLVFFRSILSPKTARRPKPPPSPSPSNHPLHDSTRGGSLAARLPTEISYHYQIGKSDGAEVPDPGRGQCISGHGPYCTPYSAVCKLGCPHPIRPIANDLDGPWRSSVTLHGLSIKFCVGDRFSSVLQGPEEPNTSFWRTPKKPHRQPTWGGTAHTLFASRGRRGMSSPKCQWCCSRTLSDIRYLDAMAPWCTS
jgi:hypothetical protein